MTLAQKKRWSVTYFLKFSGRMTVSEFLPVGVGAFVFYVALNLLMLTRQNYWDWYSFLPHALATSLCLYILFAACRRRFQDVGYKLWFPTVAILAAASSKAFAFYMWAFADNHEVEMGLALWDFVIEFPLVLLCVVLCLYALSRPSHPGPNKYGPNPHEVPS